MKLRDNKIYILHNAPAATTTVNASQQDQAKEVAVKGVVTDRDGIPVIGANISIPGTTTGTITDVDGQYNLSVPRGSVLRFSYIGYNNQDIRITNQTTVNVVMIEDVEMLDELVVVGYGVQKKSVVTAAISRV
ncbi:MAG: SusC/RagA family TonB-linked outer membrane protein, partial [Bacteroidales bacterium]|nr:SusC/RagA family TonB-linked outer membrane protein [Bacteroidales bacterium]